jgi:hypothetical protein
MQRSIDRSKSIDRSIQIKVAAFSVSIALRKRQAHLELAMSGDVRPTATTLYRVAQGSWSGKRVGCTTFSGCSPEAANCVRCMKFILNKNLVGSKGRAS